MKEEKQVLIDELLERINSSPFLVIADYTGLTVPDFKELRDKLSESGSEFHVYKNSFLKRAGRDAELPEEIEASLSGQTAIVTGESDVCAAAKVLSQMEKASGKPQMKMGVLDGKVIEQEELKALADLPPREVLLAKLLGLLQTPAQQLAQVLNEPASSLARVIGARPESVAPAATEAAPAEAPKEEEPAADSAPAQEAKEDAAPAEEAKAEEAAPEEAPAAEGAEEAKVEETPAAEAEAESSEGDAEDNKEAGE